MYKVIIEAANNGLIKTVYDDNYNGAGQKIEQRVVYDLDNDINFNKTINFFSEIAEDMSINMGNSHSDKTLNFMILPGESFTPSKSEIESTIKNLQDEIKLYKKILSEIESTESHKI